MPALKNFGITFLISALIFSIVAYFLVGFLTSTVGGILDDENDRLDSLFTDAVTETTNEEQKTSDDLPEVEGDSFTVLFGVTDRRDEIFEYLPEEEKDIEKIETDAEKSFGLLSKDYHTVKVKSIILMRVCKETREYNFIPVPSISKVYTQMGAGYTLLEDVMCFYDKEYFVQKVSAMTGITPDYTVFVNVTEMDDVLKAVGGFTCYIPEDIHSDGKNYFYVPPADTGVTETTAVETAAPETEAVPGTTVPPEEEIVIEKVVSAGNVTVGASNIEAILLYENYTEGTAGRSELLSEILKGIIGKLSQMDDATLSKVYTELTKKEKIITDMTEGQLLAKGDLLRAYGDFNVAVSEYPGDMNGELFAPDIMTAAKNYLGMRLPPDPAKAS